jgi:hypothetical protein
VKRLYFAIAAAIIALVVSTSPSSALQVTMSSAESSFVPGEPIFVWVDYFNDTDEVVGTPTANLFGFYVLSVRDQSGNPVVRPMEQISRGPLGRNTVQRIGAREHFVFFANLLDYVNLTEPGNYDVRIAAQNYAPERHLDKKHPMMSPAQLVRGPIESNRWRFTIEPGSGNAFELVNKPLREKTTGSFTLCRSATEIIEKYADSPYGPYAVMCEVDRLLHGEPHQDPLKDRLTSARTLITDLRRTHSRFAYLDIAMIRYAERLAEAGERETAANVLKELQHEGPQDLGQLYLKRLLSTQRGLPTKGGS